MQVASLRIEVIRFGVLIVLTIALLSVAFRIDSHSSSRRGAARHPGASSPSQVLPTAASRSPSTAPSTAPSAGGGSSTITGTGTAGTGGNVTTVSGPGGTAQLPATGWQGALRLSALSLVLIGGGAMTVRAAGGARPKR